MFSFPRRMEAAVRKWRCISFVPKFQPPNKEEMEQLKSYVYKAKRLLVMTGAGVSTESGIPDYRSAEVGRYARSNHRPVQYAEFMKIGSVRRRYWARNYVAWPLFSSRLPNANHVTLARWESLHRSYWLITQNVDYLHIKAGSEKLVQLHGNAFNVRCTNCAHHCSRHHFQEYIKGLNKGWQVAASEIAPDGDIDLPAEIENSFTTPMCKNCNGIMKPDIVFFGENLRQRDVQLCTEKMDEADALLVLGSSLEVLSGYRIVYQAFEQSKPILIVNIGPTRADHLATVKVSSKCGEVMKILDNNWPSSQN